MDKIDLITMLVSIISLIVPLAETILTLYKSKDEYISLMTKKKRLRESIRFINSNSGLSMDNVNIYTLTKDDHKMMLYWYCSSIAEKLNELYPKCNFRVSIKAVSNDTVSTVLTTGEELFIDDGIQRIKDNTEYKAILKDGFDYFFVTDLHTFNEKKQKYIASDPEWRYKYNTSIVFPIKSTANEEERIIGLICVNSPQTLQKKKNNKLIVQLIEKTSSNIANILQNCIL